MIIDTGAKCSDTLFLGAFPFGVSTNVMELFNQSGWSGPFQSGKAPFVQDPKTLSGVLGEGTFYPYACKLDQLSRLFWCVKSWQMTCKFTRSMQGDLVDCLNPNYDPFLPFGPQTLPTYQYCVIGGYGGDPNSLFPNEIVNKTLPLQDYCSFYSGPQNVNKTGVCPIKPDLSNRNINTCIPINPIQTFNDLLSRDTYFTWAPTETEISGYETGKTFTGFKGPYFDDWTQISVFSPSTPVDLGYDCGGFTTFEKVKSYFSFSLMNFDLLAFSGLSNLYKTGYFPELPDEVAPFDKFGKSGEVLTDKFGQVTGYGINKKPSGVWTPLLYDIGTGINYTGFSSPDNSSLYYPFFHFQMRFRNGAANNPKLCPMNETITSVYRANKGYRKVGVITIKDHLINNTLTGLAASTIMTVPLYAQSNFTSCFIDIQLRADTFWVTGSGNGIANY